VGLSAGAAWLWARRGCGRGCDVDTARRQPRVRGSGVKPKG
jgi:hypothetical protein